VVIDIDPEFIALTAHIDNNLISHQQPKLNLK